MVEKIRNYWHYNGPVCTALVELQGEAWGRQGKRPSSAWSPLNSGGNISLETKTRSQSVSAWFLHLSRQFRQLTSLTTQWRDEDQAVTWCSDEVYYDVFYFLPRSCLRCCSNKSSRWSARFTALSYCSRSWDNVSSFLATACFTLQQTHTTISMVDCRSANESSSLWILLECHEWYGINTSHRINIDIITSNVFRVECNK